MIILNKFSLMELQTKKYYSFYELPFYVNTEKRKIISKEFKSVFILRLKEDC